jgi:hypothetical protein
MRENRKGSVNVGRDARSEAIEVSRYAGAEQRYV